LLLNDIEKIYNTEECADNMAITITPYKKEDIKSVIQFNKRLSSGGVNFKFPETHVSEWLPNTDGTNIYMDFFLAKEKNEVRGGYIIKHQRFFIKGKTIDLPLLKSPISEGIIDRSYVTLGIRLLLDVLKKHPVIFTLGIGGYGRPVARMLKTSKWSMFSVPFYFKIHNPFNFLRKIYFLRKKKVIKTALDILAFTGIGVLGLYLLQWILDKRYSPNRAVMCERFYKYETWADELWEKVKQSYALIAVRDAQTLNILYAKSSRFINLGIKENNRIIGWAVVLDSQMKNHRHFGDMRLGTMVDSLAYPENAAKVISSASEYLKKRGVDIIVANYSHSEWRLGFKKSGFLKGPSNFIFASSQDLTRQISPFQEHLDKIFMCRGDGDGPYNL